MLITVNTEMGNHITLHLLHYGEVTNNTLNTKGNQLTTETYLQESKILKQLQCKTRCTNAPNAINTLLQQLTVTTTTMQINGKCNKTKSAVRGVQIKTTQKHNISHLLWTSQGETERDLTAIKNHVIWDFRLKSHSVLNYEHHHLVVRVSHRHHGWYCPTWVY